MTRTMNFCLAAVAAVFVSGCLEVKTVVHVEKDGSGTIEQTVYYQEMDLGAMGMTFGAEGETIEFGADEFNFGEPTDNGADDFNFGEPADNGADDFDFGEAADDDGEAFDFGEQDFTFSPAEQPTEEQKLAATRAEAEKTAAKMGEGVTVETVEALPPRDDGRKGVRIVYAFTDINNLRLDTLPEVDLGGGMRIGADAASMGMGGFDTAGEFGEDSAADDEGDPIRFEFTSDPTPTLTILTPEMTPPTDAAGPPPTDDPQALAMAKMMMTQMFNGMLMEFQVRVDGRITETNATYVSPSRRVVGLYRMDFDGLVKNPAALDKLLTMDATDEEAAKAQLQDPLLSQHLKIETNDRIEIAFE